MQKYIIDEKTKNNRIDKIIPILNPQITRQVAQRLIESGNIKVNEKKVKVSYKVSIGEEINIIIPEVKEAKIVPQDIDIQVLYEDKDIIVVNKSKGLVVHPANGNPDGTLVNALMNICNRKFIWNRRANKTRNST